MVVCFFLVLCDTSCRLYHLQKGYYSVILCKNALQLKRICFESSDEDEFGIRESVIIWYEYKMSRFPVRWSELLLFSVFSHLFVNWNSSFHECSILQCNVPLCFHNLTPTLCVQCFLLSFICSFSPCLPPHPPPPPACLSFAPTPLSASAVLSCAVCLVLQGQDRAVLTGTSPEQYEIEGGRHRN